MYQWIFNFSHTSQRHCNNQGNKHLPENSENQQTFRNSENEQTPRNSENQQTPGNSDNGQPLRPYIQLGKTESDINGSNISSQEIDNDISDCPIP